MDQSQCVAPCTSFVFIYSRIAVEYVLLKLEGERQEPEDVLGQCDHMLVVSGRRCPEAWNVGLVLVQVTRSLAILVNVD